MAQTPSIVVTVSGTDRPGVGALLWNALGELGHLITDIEQITVRGQLLLCAEIDAPAESDLDALLERLAETDLAREPGISVTAVRYSDPVAESLGPRQMVTVVAPEMTAQALEGIFSTIASLGGTVERIMHLSSYPVTSYELTVAVADAGALRARLIRAARRLGVDLAVQRAGLYRRAKHLIVMDADSTLLQGEVIDALAAKCGCEDAVAAITERAMAGELDFEASLRERVGLLAGLPATVLDEVAAETKLTPGAQTLVRTLQRLGYVAAIVSGGFTQVIDPIARGLGIDLVAANTLEVVDGVLTGKVIGAVVDRAGKADSLRRFAEQVGVPVNQTVAIGDGANDLDMLGAAGLGIAFNAKPVVRDAADAAISVPYLDAVLFFLGISRKEIEAADLEN